MNYKKRYFYTNVFLVLLFPVLFFINTYFIFYKGIYNAVNGLEMRDQILGLIGLFKAVFGVIFFVCLFLYFIIVADRCINMKKNIEENIKHKENLDIYYLFSKEYKAIKDLSKYNTLKWIITGFIILIIFLLSFIFLIYSPFKNATFEVQNTTFLIIKVFGFFLSLFVCRIIIELMCNHMSNIDNLKYQKTKELFGN